MQKRTFLTDTKPISIGFVTEIRGLILINNADKDGIVLADNGDQFPCPAKTICTYSVPPTLRVVAQLLAAPTNSKSFLVIATDEYTLNSTSQLATLSQASSGSGALTTGMMILWPAAVAPTGAVFCDGTHYNSVSDISFAPLFTLLGTAYGGAGSNDFAVPDFTGRVPVGVSPTGPAIINALAKGDAVAKALRNISHKHTLTSVAHSGGAIIPGTAGGLVVSNLDTSGDANNQDSPAFLVVNFVIFK